MSCEGTGLALPEGDTGFTLCKGCSECDGRIASAIDADVRRVVREEIGAMLANGSVARGPGR